jgi:hypothetical protein
MANAWQMHVKSTMAKNPGKSLKDCLKMASKTYSKSKSASSSVTKKSKTSKKGTRKSRKTKTKKAKKGKKGKKTRGKK